MDEQLLGLPREEVVLQRMKAFHLSRVRAIEKGDVPLNQREGGILVVHLIPESTVFGRSSFDVSTLKEQGSRLRPLGDSGGYTRFNVDGFLNYSGYQEVRAYSQVFRDGRLENVMSDVGYPVNLQAENSPYAIRHGLIERAVFDSLSAYRQFCQAVEIEPPVWLFSALVECKGHRMTMGRFRDLSEQAVDRSPAFLPELVIDVFKPPVEQQLRPWCDTFWQASGLDRSLNYDEEGNWHEPR